MTTEWCPSSSPPFMGMPACGVCANSGALGRRAFNCQGKSADEEKQSMIGSAYTVGPMLCTEEGHRGAVLYVEEHDVNDDGGEKKVDFTEDCHAFDDCDFPMTPRSSSRTEAFMDCTVGATGEISCHLLEEELPADEITQEQTDDLQQFAISQSSAAPPPTMECGQKTPTVSPSSPSKMSGPDSISAPGSTQCSTGHRVGKNEVQSTLTTSFQKAGGINAVSPTREEVGTSKGGSPSVYSTTGGEIVHESECVSVWPSRDCKIDGQMSLVRQHALLFLAWIPYSKGSINEDGTFQLQDCYTPDHHDTDKTMYTVHPIPLFEIKSITKHVPRLSWHYIVIVLNSGVTLAPFYFNKGGVRRFLSALKDHAEPFVLKSVHDPNVLLINDTPDPLQRSLNMLDLEDVILGTLPEETADSLGNKTGTGMSGTAKTGLPIMPKGATASFFGPADGQGSSRYYCNTAASVPSLPASQSEPYSQKGHISRSISGAPIPKPVLDRRRSSSTGGIDHGSIADTEVGSFEFVDMRLNEMVTREKRPWGLSITQERWRTFFDSEGEGRLIHMDQFREEVFYGGVVPELRKEAWKFLLGFYPAGSTQEDRLIHTQDKVHEYQKIRSQWETISECQEQKFFKWRDRKKRVEKDVRRTDRTHPFYSEEEGEPLQAMRRILLTYVMFNFDLGYCQGMSDLLSPLMYVLMNEVDPCNKTKWEEAESDAFWCFSALMDKRESNFHTDQRGMHSQLLGLEKMLRLLDPQLCECFKKLDSLNFFCCFRWVLILFKREFSFDEVLRLWEALWTNHKTDHFHLYMCVAILIDHRKEILHSVMEFDALLKFCVDLSGKIPLLHTMQLAEVLTVHGKPFEADCLGGLEALEISDS